ncbi:MAG: SOS response-associated peptidase [Gammaproteobacteria bacterium]|nr:SOS response-associated peptidase [Gammaproteobacteria bacterium]MDH3505522.1 SOS response-associated peptidase [Gammaproteobacteria bacterium]
MCGRFAYFVPAEQLTQHYGLASAAPQTERYNIAPSQYVLAIRQAQTGEREATSLKWGLVPHWAKDPTIGNRMINARGETVADKPSFRQAFKRRRCVIPASGFYEWGPSRAGKWPYYISPADDTLLSFAGLWEHWRTPEGEALESCTIITIAANASLARIHQRMPVCLAESGYADWLDPETSSETCLKLLAPLPDAALEVRAVSKAVNNPRNDVAALVEPVEIPSA